jgi:hypothetical protein
MSWNKTTVHFGNIIEGETLSFSFKYSGTKKYKSHSTSCGCTTGNWINNTLQATFKPKDVPVAILATGVNNYISTKFITVFWQDNTSDKLTLIANVNEKP